jgi:hypothetical protein
VCGGSGIVSEGRVSSSSLHNKERPLSAKFRAKS